MHDGKRGTRSGQKRKEEKGFDSDHPGICVFLYLFNICCLDEAGVAVVVVGCLKKSWFENGNAKKVLEAGNEWRENKFRK